MVNRIAWHHVVMRRAFAPVVTAVWAVGLAGLAWPAPAAAHVAPSVGDNNRYLKLTPMGDRVRLSYTVFYGEIPGAGMRGAIDANHDGTIDRAERAAWRDKQRAFYHRDRPSRQPAAAETH